MNHLIAAGLMFGNLVSVSSPALVQRYNRALQHLTGKTTALPDFHIDISGFSPEIGEELGDEQYLNPKGGHRQFILLTTSQKTAPLLNMRFSSSRGILQQFIAANEAALFALTARDAVAGELQGQAHDLADPSALLAMGAVRIEADTIGGHVAEAEKLTGLIERFRAEPQGWRDEALIAQMIALAGKTGDITRQAIALPAMTFAQPNFWTSLFGGLYLFQGTRQPAVISSALRGSFGEAPGLQVLDLTQRNAVAAWLESCALVEPIVQARGARASAALRQKMDFILLDAASAEALDPGEPNRAGLRRIAASLGADLPAEVQGLAALVGWCEGTAPWPRLSSDHPAYFYTLRAAAGPDRDLVDMLLSDLAPLDLRQRFLSHKPAFYARYATWPDTKRRAVVEFLAREYQVDRQGAREALFGPEPPMDARAPVAGPWGAVRRVE